MIIIILIIPQRKKHQHWCFSKSVCKQKKKKQRMKGKHLLNAASSHHSLPRRLEEPEAAPQPKPRAQTLTCGGSISVQMRVRTTSVSTMTWEAFLDFYGNFILPHSNSVEWLTGFTCHQRVFLIPENVSCRLSYEMKQHNWTPTSARKEEQFW